MSERIYFKRERKFGISRLAIAFLSLGIALAAGAGFVAFMIWLIG